MSDGRSHIPDLNVGGIQMGVAESELKLATPTTVKVSAQVAAFLPEAPDTTINQELNQKPYWHIEKARIEDSRQVKVELVVNGYAVAEKVLTADGNLQDIAFDVPIEHSSWVALRIFPSSHSNPVFVVVDNKPIRASRQSAQWCLEGVENCWSQKERFIQKDEMEDAVAAYDHARKTYQKILAESTVEH